MHVDCLNPIKAWYVWSMILDFNEGTTSWLWWTESLIRAQTTALCIWLLYGNTICNFRKLHHKNIYKLSYITHKTLRNIRLWTICHLIYIPIWPNNSHPVVNELISSSLIEHNCSQENYTSMKIRVHLLHFSKIPSRHG